MPPRKIIRKSDLVVRDYVLGWGGAFSSLAVKTVIFNIATSLSTVATNELLFFKHRIRHRKGQLRIYLLTLRDAVVSEFDNVSWKIYTQRIKSAMFADRPICRLINFAGFGSNLTRVGVCYLLLSCLKQSLPYTYRMWEEMVFEVKLWPEWWNPTWRNVNAKA